MVANWRGASRRTPQRARAPRQGGGMASTTSPLESRAADAKTRNNLRIARFWPRQGHMAPMRRTHCACKSKTAEERGMVLMEQKDLQTDNE